MSQTARQPIKSRWSGLDMEDVQRGVRRCGFGTDRVLLVLNELQPGIDAQPHAHDFDQLVLVLTGKTLQHLDGKEVVMEPGEVLLIPGGVEHCAEPIGSEPAFLIDIFAPARRDYMHLIAWMNDTAGADGS